MDTKSYLLEILEAIRETAQKSLKEWLDYNTSLPLGNEGVFLYDVFFSIHVGEDEDYNVVIGKLPGVSVSEFSIRRAIYEAVEKATSLKVDVDFLTVYG